MERRPIQSICLALPAYNEAAVIGDLLDVAGGVLAGRPERWSIVVVDDGSRDETAAVVEAQARENSHIRLVQHPENRGLGPAIITCLQSGLAAAGEGAAARAEHLVVCMDADLTHPPETIPAMIDAANGGAELVIASRFQPGSRQVGVPLFRRFMSWGARILFDHYLDLPGVRDYTCGFRAFRGELIERGFERFGEAGLITRSGFACTDELLVHLAMIGADIREVPFELRYDRKVGESKMDIPLTIKETLKLLRAHRNEIRREAGRQESS